jgi:hypothetical protein
VQQTASRTPVEAVRYRLRRLEERTGRSLSNPRAVAELSSAYEIDCALVAGLGAGG